MSTGAPPQSILLIRPSALGDVCRTVPALVSLRRAWPHARIDWVVREAYRDAVVAHPDLNEAIALPPHRPGGFGPARLWRWARTLKARGYDLAIDLQGLGRSALIARGSGARRRVGSRDARECAWLAYTVRHAVPPSARHTVDRMLALLQAEGVAAVPDMRLYVPEEDERWWAQRRRELGIDTCEYAVLAPTSRWLTKRWPATRWSTLVRPLLMRGFTHLVVIGAPGEREQAGDLLGIAPERGLDPDETPTGNITDAAHADSPVIDLLGATRVGQAMAVIRGAGLLIANDSAPLHMAVGLGTPCVGLYGPTDPALVGPYGKPQAALRLFAPRPGEIISYRDAKLGDRLMRIISTAAVVQQVDRVLRDASPGQSVHATADDGADGGRGYIFRGPLYLASASPRRRLMLERAGIDARVLPPDVDDGRLRPGAAEPEQWVMALAYLKARRVVETLHGRGERVGTVLGADTVCLHAGRMIGQPRDAEHARRLLASMRNQSHHTITGVCLIDLAKGRRRMFADRAEVRIGPIPDEAIDRYVRSGEWRGKAGGYNLSERLEAGWPIEVVGDPSTVMGLPMRRLSPMLPHTREARA